MNDTAKIRKVFLLHEGGTKYFQTLEVTTYSSVGRASPRVATMTNWGSYVGKDAPRMCTRGQRKLLADTPAHEKITEKRGRGYREKGAPLEVCNLSIDELKEVLNTELGDTETRQMLQALDVSPSPKGITAAWPVKPEVAKAAYPAPAEPDERPDNWGAF